MMLFFMSLLQCTDLAKQFSDGENITAVLEGVNLTVDQGQSVAVVGSSGSGKSTFLHILGGLDTPTSGTVLFNNENIHQFNQAKAAQWRNKNIGFIYQFHHLLPEFTALENVAMPLLIAGQSSITAEETAQAMLVRVGLAHRIKHFPSQLSGGERQRVAIARAMVHQPELLFADEPTGNLDNATGLAIYALLLELKTEYNMTSVIVTHDAQLAAKCDKQVTLTSGKMAEL